MLVPRIVYTTLDGVNHSLDIQLPPTNKPLFNKKAQRTDLFSTAGVRQTRTLRVDEVVPINMKTIIQGEDSDAWQAFLDWAVEGNPFTYYPDSENETTGARYFLVETNAQLAYSTPGIYSFTGTFQKEVSA